MIKIETSRELKMKNVLSLRKKMTAEEIDLELIKIDTYIMEKSLIKKGPVVTATFSVENINTVPLIDMEIMVPLNQPVENEKGYKLKKEFYLKDALYSRYKGKPDFLQYTYNDIDIYMQVNGLIPITTAYNVNLKDVKPWDSLEEMEVDIYVGINPNRL